MKHSSRTARFIALPVGQGDSFFLEQADGFTVLVDGGRNRQALESLFRAHTRRCGVDVLICTHNDADHANGVLGFLESGLACKEVWLPGRWRHGLAEVLGDLASVADRLIDEIDRFAGEGIPPITVDDISAYAPLEWIGNWFSKQSDQTNSKRRESGRTDPSIFEPGGSQSELEGMPESLIESLERAGMWEWPSSLMGSTWALELLDRERFYRSRVIFDDWQSDPLPLYAALLVQALDAAQRIREIALAAFHRRIPVRWLEYAPNHSCGCAQLTCLNAKPAQSRMQRVTSLLQFLALTVANRESLVFHAPAQPIDGDAAIHPGVLFTADSDLKSCSQFTLSPGAIVTAPHHGSEANKAAYPIVKRASGRCKLIWVRSDGRYRSRPGPSFRRVKRTRYCTMCRLGGGRWSMKEAVELQASSGAWGPNGECPPCLCRGWP